MRIAVAVTSVADIEPTWTTVHLVDRALDLGHEVRIVEWPDFEVTSGRRLVARAVSLGPPSPGREALAEGLRGGSFPRRYLDVGTCGVLLLRINRLTETPLSFARMAQDLGVQVVNDPAGIALTRSKAWLASLHGVPTPATLVTRSRVAAWQFAAGRPGPVVVKPDIGSGGRNVSFVPAGRRDLLDLALDQAWSRERGHAIVQEYLDEADQGEKRLVWLDGEVVGGYLRMRAGGEFRHNLKNGATPQPCEVDATDRAIARAIETHLARNGVRLAGLDVIGQRLVEVNTLNPGGVHFANRFAGEASDGIAAAIVRRLAGGESIPSARAGRYGSVGSAPVQRAGMETK